MPQFLKSTSFDKHTLPLTLLVILITLFFYPVIFQNQNFFFGDNTTHIVPNMIFWKNSILTKSPPLWNPYIFAGVPHLANPATNTLSPFNLIFLAIQNPYRALSILIVLDTLVASVTTYFLLINLKLKKLASLFGAITFTFSGTTLAAINDLNSYQAIILIPAVILAASMFKNNPSPKRLAVLSVVLSLQFISGHPQYSFYTWILVTSFLLINLGSNFFDKIKYTFLTFLLCVSISALQIIPFVELTNHTQRPSSTEFANQNSLQILDLPRFILANFYGNWKSGVSWGPNSPLEVGRANSEGFIGLLPLAMTFIALRKTHSKTLRFFAITALLSFILSFGSLTPIFTLARQIVPMSAQLRSPIRILAIYSFSIAIVSSHGVDWLQKKYAKS